MKTEELTAAMERALLDTIRNALRQKILARINPDIEEAIDAALETFTTRVAVWKDNLRDETLIEIVVEKK